MPVKYLLPYLGVRILSACLRVMPFAMLSILSRIISIFLHHILRYRRETAMHNLANCFPEKSHLELKRMLSAVYLNVSDVFLETIKAFSISPLGILRHIEPPSREQLSLYQSHFRGAILATAHFTNWEWCGYSLTEILPGQGIAVYRPLKNPYVDLMMHKHREKSRMKIVPMRQIVKLLAGGAAASHFVLLIADQSPDPDSAQWEDFFGIRTAFFKGPATLAQRYNLPVFFVYLERIRRHHYRMCLEPLSLDPKSHTLTEITRLYVQSLEQRIRNTPESWLWTHRRWKHALPV